MSIESLIPLFAVCKPIAHIKKQDSIAVDKRRQTEEPDNLEEWAQEEKCEFIYICRRL